MDLTIYASNIGFRAVFRKLISNLYILYGSSHMQVLKTEIWNECHKNVWVVSILFYEL